MIAVLNPPLPKIPVIPYIGRLPSESSSTVLGISSNVILEQNVNLYIPMIPSLIFNSFIFSPNDLGVFTGTPTWLVPKIVHTPVFKSRVAVADSLSG
jgi:hypothetical protein